MTTPKTFYATFGFNQTLRNCYTKFEAADESEAHSIMYEAYGTIYAFIYPEERFADAIERHGIKEVPFGTPNGKEYD